MSIQHFYSQTVADGTATSVVRPSAWNSEHKQVLNIAGNTLGTSQITGSDIVWAGGTNISLSANGSTVSIVGPDLSPYLTTAQPPGAKATIITPHWSSNRAYGDPTHQWPPVAEMSFYYLSKDWRATQAPHTDKKWNKDGYSCNFQCTWGYSFAPELGSRNQEYVQFALANYKEAAQDLHATIVKV